MKYININKTGLRNAWSRFNLNIKLFVLCTLIFAGSLKSVKAQDTTFTKPYWWFGVAAGANVNFYNGSTQQLNDALMAPVAFHKGQGVGLFIAPLIEYHSPKSAWGFMLQAGYDNRQGKFKEVFSPCNCPRDLNTNLSYITIEPSLRLAPFKSDFYLYAGPRFAFNMAKSFNYEQKSNPLYPNPNEEIKVKSDFSKVQQNLISMQVGAGYDIQLSNQSKRTKWVISPFVAFHPYFGQGPRTIETWNLTTLRFGAALKLGRGRKISDSKDKKESDKVAVVPVPVPVPVKKAAVVANVNFTVHSPENIVLEHRVRETFPLRNYVFFNLGSTEIPDRYVLLNKSQVKDFKEDQLEVLIPKRLSGRSSRQMIIYYNLLNIVGDRMGKNPSATINLVGSSEKGPEDGLLMAQSVKNYLTDVFGIDGSRITTEGNFKPKIPSEKPGRTSELELLREGDRRVSIESHSPAMLMEFQSGPDAPLKPIEIITVIEAPAESYVSITAAGQKEAYTSWSLEIKDEKGEIQEFGPYTKDNVTIPGKSILGSRPEGDYKVTMIGQTRTGETVRKDTTVHMVLWKVSTIEEGMRYSIIYEFNDSKAIAMYDKYITEVIIPKIPLNSKVIIHGYTDIIGDEAYNLKLSRARAEDVKKIFDDGLAKAGRSDVRFEVYGFGEDPNLVPFENNFPEQRFYNRTVIIDIIPK